MKTNRVSKVLVVVLLVGSASLLWTFRHQRYRLYSEEAKVRVVEENCKVLTRYLDSWCFRNNEYPEDLSVIFDQLQRPLLNPYTIKRAVAVPLGQKNSQGNFVYLRTDAASLRSANIVFDINAVSEDGSIELSEYYPNEGCYLFGTVKTAGVDVNFDGKPDGLVGPYNGNLHDHYHIGTCMNDCARPLRQVLETFGYDCKDKIPPDQFPQGVIDRDTYPTALYLYYEPEWPTDKHIQRFLDYKQRTKDEGASGVHNQSSNPPPL